MKNLCILPFIHLSTKPKGQSRYCCFAPNNVMTKSNGEIINFGKENLSNIWDSDHARNIRKRMISGERLPECQLCWKEEEAGKVSKRMRENRNYYPRFSHRVEHAKNNDGKLNNHLPIYLDLRPGNLCNLKCRSCNPLFSSLFAKEVVNRWDKDLLKTDFPGYHPTTIEIKDWFDTDIFLKNIEKILPQLEHIYISGGEPMFINRIIEVLKKCVEKDYAKNILLRLNTNTMVVNDLFIDLFSHFKHVNLGPSIDAYGKKIRYIRYPAKWENIENNLIQYFKTGDNVSIDINCTVTLMNVMYLDELYTHLHSLSKTHKKKINIVTEIAHDPDFLNANILTSNLKKVARERIEGLLSRLDFNNKETNEIKSMLDLMDKTPKNIESIRRKFRRFTNHLDEIRGENFAETFPELQEMMNTDNIQAL